MKYHGYKLIEIIGRLKGVLYMILALAIIMLSSCSSRLNQVVGSVNKECPLSLGYDGILNSMTINGDSVVVEYTIFDNIFNINTLKERLPLVKKYMLAILQNAEEKTQSDFKVIAEESEGILFRYTGYTTGKTISYSISSAELLDVINKGPDKKALLKATLNFSNLIFPIEALPGHVEQKLSVEKDLIVCDVLVDENRFSIRKSEENTESMKNSIKSKINPTDPLIKLFLNICRDFQVGLAYRYTGSNSGELFVVKIPYSELPVNDRRLNKNR